MLGSAVCFSIDDTHRQDTALNGVISHARAEPKVDVSLIWQRVSRILPFSNVLSIPVIAIVTVVFLGLLHTELDRSISRGLRSLQDS